MNDYFEKERLRFPSLDVGAPRKLPIAKDAEEVSAAQRAVIEATMELQALMMGPQALLKPDIRILPAATFLGVLKHYKKNLL